MVDRIVHQILDGVRLLAVGKLDNLFFVADPAVIGGYDHIDAEAVVLEIVLVGFGILAVAFKASDNDTGIKVRDRVDRYPAFDHRFFERQARCHTGVQAGLPVMDDTWSINFVAGDAGTAL